MRGSQRPNDQKSLKDPQAKLQKPKFAASSHFPIQLGYDHKWVVYPRVSNKPKFPQIIYTVLVLSLYHVISPLFSDTHCSNQLAMAVLGDQLG